MELLRQWSNRFGQQAQTIDLDRELPGLGAKHHPLGTDNVAEIPLLEGGIDTLWQCIALDEELDLATHVLHMGKGGFAHHPLRHHPASHSNPNSFRLQRLAIHRLILGMKLTRHHIATEIVREGVTLFTQCIQFLATFSNQAVLINRDTLFF